MGHPSKAVPGGSSRDFLEAWNLESNPGSQTEDDDIGLYTPEDDGSTPASLIEAGHHRIGGDSQSREQSGLIQAFQLGSEWDQSQPDVSSGPGTVERSVGREPRIVGLPSSSAIAFPKRGDELAGFQIISELGRGAFARVYLARQKDLGQRLVALKVSRAEGEEPQILARLQHAHIVPIHSVHNDSRSKLQLMCMPYLGGANLAQVIEATESTRPEEMTGRSMVEALDVVSNRLQSIGQDGPESGLQGRSLGSLPARSQVPTLGRRDDLAQSGPRSLSRIQSLWSHLYRRRLPEPAEGKGDLEAESMQPSRRFLREADHIQASVWIVARLAEGLDHAHSRGMLHRDLKPSNILIAADGTPMLLDFNLSITKRTDDPDEGTKAMIGGTLPYMAPEHLDAFNPDGTTPPEAVDERADLYSLGLILFETIAGVYPFAEPRSGAPVREAVRFILEQRRKVPSLRAFCAEAPWSLDALVAKCLDPDPERRYARARDLAEDLRRFLDNLPFKHAPEPSLRERMVKWARRNPRACSSTSIALLSMVLLIVLGGVMGMLAGHLRHVSARLRLQVFHSDFEECRFLLNTTSGPLDHLRRGIALAQRTLDQMGVGPASDSKPNSWVRHLTPAEQLALREQASDLILLEARARVVRAERFGTEADRRTELDWAVQWLDRAERLDPSPPGALFGLRARYLAALGEAERAARDRQRAARTPPTTSRDFSLLGTALLNEGDLRGAEAALHRALAINPRGFWTWFALGHCHFEQGRYVEAAGDFGACTALEPRFAWPHMNRGLALAKAGQLTHARDCYHTALDINPRFVEALLNSALANLELNDLAAADSDLARVIALGRDDAPVLVTYAELQSRLGRREKARLLFDRLLKGAPSNPAYLVARGFFQLGADPVAARADFESALEREPRNARAHYGLGLLLRKTDPVASRRAVDAALSADPSLIDALQLRAILRARAGDLAAVDDVERLAQTPSAYPLFNAACALAILSETAHEPKYITRALSLLDRALAAGFPLADAERDPDLTPLRERDEFAEVLRKHGKALPQNP